ncbi:hypothetical protein O3M35_008648 [Rhynocoris fuscipes]|uniref:FLYWCH-type domain-containing protein n=1 Tax=Rhynocoris fuscipes TaxID=488301 RepID=A0AAW1D712_9HEMI
MDNKNYKLKKIYSQRGNLLVLKNGFKFSKYGELQTGEIGWKCVEKSCRAKLYTNGGDECRFSRETGEHKHKPLDEKVILRQAISNRLKRKSAECLSEKPSKLVEKELNSEEMAALKLTENDIKLIKDNMYHARAKRKQTLPNYEQNDKFENCYNLKQYIMNHPSIEISAKQSSEQTNLTRENLDDEWIDWFWIKPHFLAPDVV